MPKSAAQPDGDFYVRTDILPETVFQALGRLRNEAEEAIERLLAIVDAIDADPDFEPSGDELDPSGDEREPELGSVDGRKGFDQSTWCAGDTDDREGDPGFDDREGDELQHGGESEREDNELSGDEDEPQLGSFDRLTNQDHGWRQTAGGARTWPAHCNSDVEVDRADRT